MAAVTVSGQALARWRREGCNELDEVLSTEAVRLLDARWLVELSSKGGVLGPRQSLPEHAFLSLAQVQMAAAIVCVSHCWLQPDHPDPRGYNLRTLARALELRLKHSPGRQVAVFYDFCCIFQKCRGSNGKPMGHVMGWAADETDAVGRLTEEDALFRKALGSLGILYSLPRTHVFMLTAFPPDYEDSNAYTRTGNVAPYVDRGWCFCESSWAMMVKAPEMTLDLGKDTGEDLSNAVNADTGATCLPWNAYVNMCKVGRRAPITPEAFACFLEEKNFTNGSTDRPRVAALYRNSFEERFASASWLGYTSLGWGVDEARAVAEVLSVGATSSLQELSLQYNLIGDAGAKEIAKGIPHAPKLRHLRLGNNGIGDEGAEALASCLPSAVALNELRLGVNCIGAKGAAALARSLTNAVTLERLHLHENNVGDVGAVALAKVVASSSRLRLLVLNKNEIGDKGGLAFAQALQNTSALDTLALGGNLMSDSAALAFAAAFPNTTTLKMLDVGSNAIGVDGARALIQAAPKAAQLCEIVLHANAMKDDDAVLEALRKECVGSKIAIAL